MAIGQADLVAQKILGSGNEGFGDGAVIPYRKTDDPVLPVLDRIAMLKHQHAKENADNLADQQKRLPAINRRVQERQLAERQALTNYGTQLSSQGNNVATHPGFQQALNDHVAKVNAVNQFEQDYNQKKAEIGQLGEFTNKPVLLKKLQDEYEMGVNKVADKNDYSNVQSGFTTSGSDPDAFDTNKFLAATTKAFGDTVKSNDTLSNGPYGQLITQDSDKYKFAPDPSNPNNIHPDVLKHFTSDQTNDPNMLQYRATLDKLANTVQENEAIRLNHDANSPYFRKGVSKIMDLQARPGTDISFDKDAVKNNLVNADLKPYQDRATKHDISSGHAYPKAERGDAEKEKVTITPTTVSIKSPVTKTVGGETTITHYNEINLPGTLLVKKDKPFQLKGITPATIWDTNAGHVQENNVDPINMEATHVALGLINENGKIASFKTPEEQEEFIKNATPTQLKKYKLQPLVIGNLQEKSKIKGDTEESAEVAEGTTATNRQVAIPYKEGGTEANMIKTISANSFKFSPQMEKVQKLWNDKNKPTKRIAGIAPTKSKVVNKGGNKIPGF